MGKTTDFLQARGCIHVQKWRLEDPADPLQQALALSVRPSDDHCGLYVPDGEAVGANMFLNVGINRIWELVIGASADTFTNAEAQIGIGDSSTAASAGQTDLQASTNKVFKGMEAGYPTAGTSQQAVFRSTFGTTDANFAWQEFCVRRATGTLLLNRGVSSMGTKTSAGIWVVTVTLSLS